MLPNFVIIGGMKCGSTALWKYMLQRPEIYLPPKQKNLEFFDGRGNWQRGLSWYESFYTEAGNNYAAIGEVSTEYTKFPQAKDVAANMASMLPNARLIYLVRNPIERTISHYLHMVGAAKESRSFEEATRDLKGNPYIDYSMYYFQLEQFLPYYPVDRVLIVLSQELRSDRNTTLNKIYQFLNVKIKADVADEIRANQYSERRRWNWLGQSIRRNENRFNTYSYLKRRYPALGSITESIISRPLRRPKLSEGSRERLSNHFRTDLEKLERACDLDLDCWKL